VMSRTNTRRTLGLTAWLILVSSPITSAADWPQFRGPGGQGHAVATGLPTEWTATRNVRWKVAIPGLGWSSPVCIGDRIYLTTAVSGTKGEQDDQSLRAVCLDMATGRTIWNREVFSGNVVPTIDLLHSKNSHASPTPASDGKSLFVHFGTEGTARLDLKTGGVIWKNRQLRYIPRHGNGGSPALVGNLLVVACDGQDIDFVAALDIRTGQLAWKIDRTIDSLPRKFSFSTPLAITVENATQIVVPGTGLVAAYDPKDGREIWRVDYGDGYSVIPRPVFGQGLVYVCTGWSPPSLLAIRPTGQGNVTRTHVAWKSTVNVPNTPSLLLIDDALYFFSDGGIASCIDAANGQARWRKRIGGNFSASPTYADGKIYAQSEQGVGIVLKPGNRFVELARNRLEARTFSSYAVADNALFIRTERALYRIEQK